MRAMLPRLDALCKERAKKPSDCVESSTAAAILVYDDTKTEGEGVTKFKEIGMLSEEEIQALYFKITNPDNIELTLFRLDGDFFKNRPGGICDAAVFSADLWLFLEFKMDATSGNPKSIEDNRRKAVTQLEAALKYFLVEKSLRREFTGMEVEANLCSPPHYPRKDTSLQSFAVRFLETYGVELYENNGRDF